MRVPRGLSAEEVDIWAKVAATVKPLPGRVAPPKARPEQVLEPQNTPSKFVKPPAPRSAAPLRAAQPAPKQRPIGQGGLDSHWDKRLKAGTVAPDFTLDLHGHSLDTAHGRLESGLAQARAMDARLVLVVTGKPRPVEAADRAERRGAIRAKILDWLAAGPHADSIAAIRRSHQRHGGDGALYLVLRRG